MDLQKVRSEIDELDNQLAELLNKRMELVNHVAQIKKQSGIKITDSNRENEILERVCTGENAEYLKKIFNTIFEVSKEKQRKNNEG